MVNGQAPLRDRLMERPVRALDFTAQTADKKISNTAVILIGWSVRESTGAAAATVEFEASLDTAGPHCGEIQLAQGTAQSFSLPAEGVLCESGLLLHVIAGSVTGCAYVRA